MYKLFSKNRLPSNIMIIRSFRINSVSLKPLFIKRTIFTGTRLLDDSSSSDEENDKSKRKPNRDEAVKKLNDLIRMMAKKEPPTKLASQVKVPKPREITRFKGFAMKKQRELEAKQFEDDKLGNKLADAATKVAESLGGDVKQTEKELLDIYFTRRFQTSTPETENKELSDVLLGMKVEKGEEVSETKSSDGDELSRTDVGRDRRVPKKSSWIKKGREQFASYETEEMRGENEEVPSDVSRAHQVRSMMKDDKPKQFFTKRTRYAEVPMNLFGEQPFKYFDVDKIKAENVTPVSLPTWDYLYQRDLNLLVTYPPKNIFEQLIQWTEQGKVWRFPIDNEQDWLEEQKYDFSDHVFLERWLEPWCPESGSIRYFMELVCVGLSKNPYLTVSEKKAHIFWYEHYFRSKNKLLMETGVGEIKSRTAVETTSA